MLEQPEKNENLNELLLESSSARDLRAQRIWRLVIVMWATWLFNTGFLWLRGYEDAGPPCLFASLAHLVIILTARRTRDYRAVMHLCLATSAVGLFLVSTSHPAMRSTMLFFPVSILVASQLAGVRDAFYWLLVNVAAFVLYEVTVHGNSVALGSARLDELILLVGVAACTFFCCHQGEDFFQARTRDLLTLSERLRRKSERLHVLATTDALTGLKNRYQFHESLRSAIEHASERSEPLALFLIDMDGFKEINDTLGHPVGDEALIQVATRLRDEFAGVADVARLGGDEFCIIYPRINGADHAAEISQRVLARLTEKYLLSEAEVPMGASIGYVLFPEHTQSDQEMLSYADTAMFHAKETRTGHACYQPEMTDRLVEYRTTQERLSVALERDEFFLVYQPKVDLRTGEIHSVEALLRWRHNGEVIPPWKFISLLEQSGEIIPVSNWIVQQTCEQIAIWEREGFDLGVSVNVSAVQFNDDGFPGNLAVSMREMGVDPSKLECEITEGLLIDDVEQAVDKLNQIKEMGIRISIDDFGTGYSSLAYLRQFPIDTLKIDRAFIKDIPHGDDGTIAASIIVLAKALGLTVIAEGVETEEHIKFLEEQLCDEYQGYYLTPPVSPEEITEILRQRAAGHSSENADHSLVFGSA